MIFNRFDDIIASGKKYKIIYCDCPWNFKSYDNHNVCPYPVMSDEDIYNLPVSQIADKDCVLLSWVTFPKLITGIKTIEKWGFTYKSLAFNWVKRNKKSDSFFWGMGYWTRQNPEICLLATKGKPKRVNSDVHCIIDTRIEEHSKKPAIVRDKIIRLLGDLPRIELFARQSTDGWDCFGNQVDENNQDKLCERGPSSGAQAPEGVSW